MHREFIVQVIGTLLVVSDLYLMYTSMPVDPKFIMQMSIMYHCIEMCKYTKTMKMKNTLMCIICYLRVAYVFIGV